MRDRLEGPDRPLELLAVARVLDRHLHRPLGDADALGRQRCGDHRVCALDARGVGPLQRLGYVYWAENPDKTKMFLVKGMPPFGTGRTHHIHVHTPDAVEPVIRFRDHLRANPDDARHYEALKRELAAKFATDREGYTSGKDRFVQDVLRKAGPSSG